MAQLPEIELTGGMTALQLRTDLSCSVIKTQLVKAFSLIFFGLDPC